MNHAIKAVIYVQMLMTIIVLNAQMDSSKIELLKLRNLKDAFKLVPKEHFNEVLSVRNVI